MNNKQREYIVVKLIPAILREQGRGFNMQQWRATGLPIGESLKFDDVARNIPPCGTVACIGGTITMIEGRNTFQSYGATVELGKLIGLTHSQASGLFYNWDSGSSKYGWPSKYRKQFEKATTPLEKAEVAAKLLLEIALKGGKILERR